jgi:hypothetical protein
MMDLFGDGCATIDDFKWSVAMFKANGAVQVIKRASDYHLKTYYPFKRNKFGDFSPLWRNYLFIQFQKYRTLSICRSTSNFIKMLSIDNQPILVRKDAIDESMHLLQLGKFDDVTFKRPFYGKGSLVQILTGDFSDRRAELLTDISGDVPGNVRVPISIGGWKASIEVHKLAL